MIHLITGGERSGKSRYAQRLALEQTNRPLYLATARRAAYDDSFEQRIIRHQQERDARWTTREEPLYVSTVIPREGVVVMDCVTLWLTNWFTKHQYRREETLDAVRQEFDRIDHQHTLLLIVTNEVGMGLHATTEVGRDFVELQGWINQHIAQRAQQVTLMVSGLPLTVKEVSPSRMP